MAGAWRVRRQAGVVACPGIPGQEAGNVRVLAEHGIGLSDKTLPEIALEIKALAASPEKIEAALYTPVPEKTA